MGLSVDEVTLDAPVQYDLVVASGLARPACEALFRVMEHSDAIEAVSAKIVNTGDEAHVRVASPAKSWTAGRFYALPELHDAGVRVLRIEALEVIEDVTDDELRQIVTGDDDLCRAKQYLLSGSDILCRLLAWVSDGSADWKTSGRIAQVANAVLANDRTGDGPETIAEAIALLADKNTQESRFAAGHLLSGLGSVANDERRFGLRCAVADSHFAPFVQHRSWEINQAALEGLAVVQRPLGPEATQAVLSLAPEALESKRDSGLWAGAVVRALGSVEDSPQLRQLLRDFLDHPLGEPRAAAADELVRLGGLEEARPLWHLFMNQRSTYNRMYAEELIDRFATEDDIADVAEYLGKRLKKNKTQFSPTPQAGHLLLFLSRHPENGGATDALQAVTRRFDRLAEPLQDWIRRMIPDLVPSGR